MITEVRNAPTWDAGCPDAAAQGRPGLIEQTNTPSGTGQEDRPASWPPSVDTLYLL